ncbi:hypothetical protein OK016_27535 [Vibrio chagasii]|nr:hypothetical protein [Vibrio chagasii]
MGFWGFDFGVVSEGSNVDPASEPGGLDDGSALSSQYQVDIDIGSTDASLVQRGVAL